MNLMQGNDTSHFLATWRTWVRIFLATLPKTSLRPSVLRLGFLHRKSATDGWCANQLLLPSNNHLKPPQKQLLGCLHATTHTVETAHCHSKTKSDKTMYASEPRNVRPRKRSRTSASTKQEQDQCISPAGQVPANGQRVVSSSDEGSSVASSSCTSASSLQQQQQRQNPENHNHLCPMAQWTKLFQEEEDEEACCMTETTADETTTDFDSEAYNDSDYDTDDSEEENRLVKKLVRAAFSPVTLLSQAAPKVARMVGKRVTPTEHLKSLVPTAQFFNSHTLQDFFEPAVWRRSSAEEQAYSLEVAQAVRNDDLSTLQRLLLPQQPQQHERLLPCGTQSGDSIVHLACRHNAAQVLNFLLQKGLSVRYRGDYCGRTPLHEACWSAEEPDWTGVVDKLLDQCPDLLYITDRLGATALDYIAARHHEAACRYLDQRGAETLRARELGGEEEGDTALVAKEVKVIVG